MAQYISPEGEPLWHWNFHPKKRRSPTTANLRPPLRGRPFVVETGKLCGLANGSAMIRYGETCVLCNVTMSEKPRDGIDYFPAERGI